MLTTVLERNHDPVEISRRQVRNRVRPEPDRPFMSPQGNLGLGSAALALRGWRPREIGPRRDWRARLSRWLSASVAQVMEWRRRAHSREALLDLDDRSLRDIGLDRASAYREASLPFWRGE